VWLGNARPSEAAAGIRGIPVRVRLGAWPPKAKESALAALEKYAKASEEEKKEIERANEKKWKTKRLLGESPPTEEVVGQPPKKEDEPRPSKRE
jgi:hypothetical protein